MKHHLFILLLITIVSCSSDHQENKIVPQKKEANIKLTYWSDTLNPNPIKGGIYAQFETGIKNSTLFKIHINKRFINSFECKTNESIGLCLIDGESDDLNIGGFGLPDSSITDGSVLIITTEEETLNINLLDTMKNFNRLMISKADSSWQLSFENSSQINYYE